LFVGTLVLQTPYFESVWLDTVAFQLPMDATANVDCKYWSALVESAGLNTSATINSDF